MGLICSCPLGTALGDVPSSACPESFGQIQKVVFQRIESAAGVKNAFVEETNSIKVIASWTALLTAADGKKVVISPYIGAPTFEAGKIRTYGGGNELPDGMTINIGREATTFTGNLVREAPAVIAALKALQCETLGIYLIDENGHIGALADDVTTPTTYTPIPIDTLFVGDRKMGGLEAPDMNVISWNFRQNWSDKLMRIVPTDFNALTLKKS